MTPDPHPDRGLVLAAALGSSGLAIVSIPAAGLLAMVSFAFAADGNSRDLPFVLFMILAGAAVIGVGVYLMVGYWRAWRGRLVLARRVRFWTLSAAYNGIGLLLGLGLAVSTSLHSVEDTVQAALALVWLVFMVWLSVRCARAVHRSELPA